MGDPYISFCLLLIFLSPIACRAVIEYHEEVLLSQDVTFVKGIAFKCEIGRVCSLNFGQWMTNVDSLANSSYSIGGTNSSQIWMTADVNQTLVGVCLHAGTYQYVLEYKDNNGSVFELPFDVTVPPRHPPHQMFTIHTLHPSFYEFRAFPKLITKFVMDMSRSLSVPFEIIRIHDIKEREHYGTAISFTIDTEFYDDVVENWIYLDINQVKKKMILNAKGVATISFARDMGPKYFIEHIVYGVPRFCKRPPPFFSLGVVITVFIVVVLLSTCVGTGVYGLLYLRGRRHGPFFYHGIAPYRKEDLLFARFPSGLSTET